jgi:ParB/RepB/Spo0J family partition protein
LGFSGCNLAPKKAMSLHAPIQELSLDQIDMSLSDLRIMRPADLDQMRRSLEHHGQLQPIVVRQQEATYQLLDGFKRCHCSEKLGWSSLRGIVLDVTLCQGVAMILKYNRAGKGLEDYDQALIIYSLRHDHALDQAGISQLTGYSRSWVCRRLALLEKLSEPVQDALRMGLISNTHARSIVKLPRGNQQAITEIITRHQLSSRDTALLVDKFLSSKSHKEQVYVLSHPMDIIDNAYRSKDIFDARLSSKGNQVLKSMELLMLQLNIFIGQMHPLRLSETEKRILRPRLGPLEQRTKQVLSLINQNPLI